MTIEAAKLARQVADAMSTPEKRCLVAGGLGPPPKTASVSPDMEDPSMRAIDFDELRVAYKEQLSGLVQGGSHLIFIETIFDTLNAKAAIAAYFEFFEEENLERLPLFISGTLIDKAGRTLSGQTVEAFYASVIHVKPFCVGLNCALGAPLMLPFYTRLTNIASCYVHAYPNAGLPNEMGGYDETKEEFSNNLAEFASVGANMLGGCCGTDRTFIKALSE